MRLDKKLIQLLKGKGKWYCAGCKKWHSAKEARVFDGKYPMCQCAFERHTRDLPKVVLCNSDRCCSDAAGCFINGGDCYCTHCSAYRLTLNETGWPNCTECPLGKQCKAGTNRCTRYLKVHGLYPCDAEETYQDYLINHKAMSPMYDVDGNPSIEVKYIIEACEASKMEVKADE